MFSAYLDLGGWIFGDGVVTSIVCSGLVGDWPTFSACGSVLSPAGLCISWQ